MSIGTTGAARRAGGEPWQLRMFRLTLKKKQKVALLGRLLGPSDPDGSYLLLTNGDNNGAMNVRFRERGGRWSWGEFEPGGIPEMEELLGREVRRCTPGELPFPDGAFDGVVVIDVHEHLEDTGPLDRELERIVRPGGRLVVTVPSGDRGKPLAILKRAIGMTDEVYGHVRQGYTIPELETLGREAGLVAEGAGSYAHFFTELVELALNFAYVKLMGSGTDDAGPAPQGPAAGEVGSDAGTWEGGGGGGAEAHPSIAPSTAEDVRRMEKKLRLYRWIYPLCRAFSSLDVLARPLTTGYAVAVRFRKPEAGA